MYPVLHFIPIKLTEWKIELRRGEGGKERIVNVVQLAIYRDTHMHPHAHKQSQHSWI